MNILYVSDAAIKPEFNSGVNERSVKVEVDSVRRKDDKCLIYVPAYLAEDSMFPLKGPNSILVKVYFEVGGDKPIMEKWEEPENE